MSFSKFKQSQQDSLRKLSEDLAKTEGNNNKADDRLWKPTADKQGNGSAIIRFLATPAVDGGDRQPYVKYYGHSFKNEANGKWYIEKCRSTIGLPDPVMEVNGKLWEDGSYNDKSPEREQARKQKRHQHFVANILVIKDTNAPQNEGKIFLYDFGPGIFNFIKTAMNPPIDDLTKEPLHAAFDPFNFWTGADFYMRFNVKNKQRTYENSSWGAPRVLAPDNELEKIHANEFSIKEFIDPATFKSFEELHKRLAFVLGSKPDSSPREEPKELKKALSKSMKEESVDESLPWDSGSDSNTTFGSDDFDPDDFAKLLED